MVFVTHPTPHTALTLFYSCLNSMVMNIVHIPALSPALASGCSVTGGMVHIHPASVEICGRKVTHLKYAATGASHSKFPEVFASHEDKACLLSQPRW